MMKTLKMAMLEIADGKNTWISCTPLRGTGVDDVRIEG
jgi:hypothetical protein